MFMTPALRTIAAPVILIACLGAATLPSAAESASAPASMKAIAMDSPGGPEVMTLHTLPVPKLDANEILIALHTAGVAVWDLEIRQSAKYIANPKFPYILGSDGAGVVAAVGPGVTRFKVGDKVYAYCWDNPKGGFYAEYVAVSTNCVAPLPNNVSLDDAGVLGASGLTALSGVDRILHLKPGEKVIIHGASGAVGTLALQMAKARGAKVLATTSGGEEGKCPGAPTGCRCGDRWPQRTILPPPHTRSRPRAWMPFSHSPVAMRSSAAWMPCVPAAVSPIRRELQRHRSRVRASRSRLTMRSTNRRPSRCCCSTAPWRRSRNSGFPFPRGFALADAAKAHERVAAGGVLGKIALKIR